MTEHTEIPIRTRVAFELLRNGRLGDDEAEQAEALVAGRRMARLLLATHSELVSAGKQQGLDYDEAERRKVSVGEALAALQAARDSTWLQAGEGPGLIEHSEAPQFTHDIGGDAWYQEQIDAQKAPWDAVQAIASEWMQQTCPERSARFIAYTSLDIKAMTEDAASFLRRASMLRNAWGAAQ